MITAVRFAGDVVCSRYTWPVGASRARRQRVARWVETKSQPGAWQIAAASLRLSIFPFAFTGSRSTLT